MANVLVIDSESSVALQLKLDLQGVGIDAHVTGEGTDGLEYAREHKPDLIVLCVELTRGSGYSVCNKLKKDSQLATIPLILTSSQATQETFEQHKKLRTRAEAYLKKPFNFEQISSLMREFIELGGEATELEADVEVDLDDGLDADLEVSADDFSVEADEDHAPTQVVSGISSAALAGGVPESIEPIDSERRSTEAVVHDAEAEALRSENRQLRKKAQQLERQLQEKEVEFNDRLLEESGRARDGLDARKRLNELEREVQKHEQQAERAHAEAYEAKQTIQGLRTEIGNLDSERQVLSDKLGQLVEKVKSLASERDSLREQLEQLQGERSGALESEETTRKVKEKAKKAVDIAVQLLDETGLVH